MRAFMAEEVERAYNSHQPVCVNDDLKWYYDENRIFPI